MNVIFLIMSLPAVVGAAGLMFGLLARRGWLLAAFGLLAPSPVLLAAWAPQNGFSEQVLLLAGAYYLLLVAATFAGIFLAPLLRQWWEARSA